jgi:hypothetical protein
VLLVGAGSADMWFVSIVFCIFADGCYKVTDERGPYETEEQCKARLVELSAVIVENVPYLIGMSVDCKKENYDLI